MWKVAGYQGESGSHRPPETMSRQRGGVGESLKGTGGKFSFPSFVVSFGTRLPSMSSCSLWVMNEGQWIDNALAWERAVGKQAL